jgi:Polyketide cyclase / dehydrase and lipid transport
MCLVVAETPITEPAGRRVWEVLAGDLLPAVADHVLDVTATPAGQRWSVLLNGSRVDWIQRTVRADQHGLTFEQVSGDLAELRGNWALRPNLLGLTIEFDLGVDGLAPLLDPIWTQSFQAHADALVRAVAGAARSLAGEGTS